MSITVEVRGGNLEKAMRVLGIPHDKSLPYDPSSNGVAENAIRRVKEGTTCNLIQSGLNMSWWPLAMRHYCFMDRTC